MPAGKSSYEIIKESIAKFERRRGHWLSLLQFLLLCYNLLIAFLGVLEDFFYFSVVDETIFLVSAELRKHLYLNLIYFEFVGHDEEKGQRCHLPLPFCIVIFELLQISLLFFLLYIILTQFAFDLPDILQTC